MTRLYLLALTALMLALTGPIFPAEDKEAAEAAVHQRATLILELLPPPPAPDAWLLILERVDDRHVVKLPVDAQGVASVSDLPEGG